MKKIITVLVLAAMFTPFIVQAEKTNIANTYPTLGRGIRPLGMGNAFLTMKGSDENILFYNPAAIADLSNDTKFTTGLLPPAFELNYEVIELTKDIFDFKDDLDAAATDSAKIDVFQTFVDQHIGKFYNMELHTPIIGVYNRYFAVSLISDSKLGVSFRNRAFPNFEIRSTSLAGLAFGTAYGFFEDSLDVGVAAKVLYGAENEQIVTTNEILAQTLDDFKWENWRRGLAVGADIGVKYEIYDFGQNWIDTLHPTVAVAYQNIGKTRFIAMKKNGGPEDLPQSVSAGIGIHPRIGEIETSVLADFREINVKQDFLMKLNAGAEARFPQRMGLRPSIRGGMNQGYPTVGAGLEVWKLVWNVAFFGKEVGETTRQKAGYRIANEFTWRF